MEATVVSNWIRGLYRKLRLFSTGNPKIEVFAEIEEMFSLIILVLSESCGLEATFSFIVQQPYGCLCNDYTKIAWGFVRGAPALLGLLATADTISRLPAQPSDISAGNDRNAAVRSNGV